MENGISRQDLVTLRILKQTYLNCFVIFRRGDYCEVYGEDAETLEKYFDTYRVDELDNKIEGVNGFPYYNLQICVDTLRSKGMQIALVSGCTSRII